MQPSWLLVFASASSAALLPQLIGDLCHRENPCIAEAECKIDPSAPIVGRPYCVCPQGYEGDGRQDGEGCYDIDECLTEVDDCIAESEICVNTLGSFRCQCRHGFQQVSVGTHCTDVDECVLMNMCPEPNATCFNTPGSFACVCHNPTEEYIPGEGCAMKDLCTADGGAYNRCDPINGVCVSSLDTGIECFCQPGFRLEADGRTCTDVDECISGISRCPPEAFCRNLPGTYQCECDESAGWTNVGDFACGPLNECEVYPTVCSDPNFPCCMDLPPPAKFQCVGAINPSVLETHSIHTRSLPLTPPLIQSTHGLGNQIPNYALYLNPEVATHVLPASSVYRASMPSGQLFQGFSLEDVDMLSPGIQDENSIDSVSQWFENSRLFLDKGLPHMAPNVPDKDEAMGAHLLQRWTPPALQPMASYVLREWTPPGLHNVARKAYKAEEAIASRTVEAAHELTSRWTPPLLKESLSELAGNVLQRKMDLIGDELAESHPGVKRNLADLETLQTDLVKRFAEAAVDLAPKLIPPVITQQVDKQRGHSLSGLASAICPANSINSFMVRQKRTRERIPEAASTAFSFVKQAMLRIPNNKLDPNAVAVGVASNVQNFANQLSNWYQAFVALPNAIEGAASNVTSVNVVNDLESLFSTGVKSIQPIYDIISKVAEVRSAEGAAADAIASARDSLNLATNGLLPRGSANLAPIANF